METDNDTTVQLKHDPGYGVLICLKCRYAVQKSALDSHLLRHKIYREERKRLVASVSHLKVLEPDEVSTPAPSSPALAYITKFSGLRCTVTQCGHLTVSAKRMKLHWKQAHGSLELPIRGSDLARHAVLQTFFRGNKVKYFEVESIHTADVDNHISYDDTAHAGLSVQVVQPYAPDEAQSPIRSNEPQAGLLSPGNEPDMCMLRYFHHFVTATSLTLPFNIDSPLKGRHWQESVIPRALQHSWLMQGLLAISACHTAVSTTNLEAKELHCESEAQYASRFKSRAGHSVLDETAEQMSDHVQCLLHLAETALHQTTANRASDPRQRHPVTVSLRGSMYPQSTIMASQTLLGEEETAGSNDHMVEAPLEGLQTLRSRMFELLGRPANISDALTILKSIELLQETCSSVGPEDSIEVCWSAAAAWLKIVPNHFHEMVDEQDSIALLMMAYWSAIMVTRVERQGCWFLKGVAKALVLQVTEKLVVEKHPLLPLMLDFEGI